MVGSKKLMPSLIKIFVVILNWNRLDLTEKCINSLLKTHSTGKNISIVVVDNASTDNSVEKIKKKFPKINILVNRKNLGWSGGNNVGIRYALKKGADIVILINNDTVFIQRNFLAKLVKNFNINPSVGVVGPKILSFRKKGAILNAGGFFNRRYFSKPLGIGRKDKGQYDHISDVEFVSGTVMAIKKSVFKRIGYFDDKYYLYFEDADFCMRARKNGFTCMIDQQTFVEHIGGATSGNKSALHTYYNTRNHLLFVERWAPPYIKAREILRLPKTYYEFNTDKNKTTSNFGKLGIKDYILRRFGERTYW